MKIMVFNQKGGVGKTTTAINLGHGLARWGQDQVTLVDLDPQTHLSAALGVRTETLGWNVSDWLSGHTAGEERIKVARNLDLIAGNGNPAPGQAMALRLDEEKGHLIIDAPPVWSAEVAYLIGDCDCILTPLEPEFLSMQGISRLLQRMQACGIPWSRLRLLLCRYDQRLAVHREVRERLADRFGQYLLGDVIRKNVRLAEAPGYGQSIFDYAPDSPGAQDYRALVQALQADPAWRKPNVSASATH